MQLGGRMWVARFRGARRGGKLERRRSEPTGWVCQNAAACRRMMARVPLPQAGQTVASRRCRGPLALERRRTTTRRGKEEDLELGQDALFVRPLGDVGPSCRAFRESVVWIAFTKTGRNAKCVKTTINGKQRLGVSPRPMGMVQNDKSDQPSFNWRFLKKKKKEQDDEKNKMKLEYMYNNKEKTESFFRKKNKRTKNKEQKKIRQNRDKILSR